MQVIERSGEITKANKNRKRLICHVILLIHSKRKNEEHFRDLPNIEVESGESVTCLRFY